MDKVGHDVVEQPLVVRHQHNGVVLVGELIDALRDDSERIDVETGIGLIEDRQTGIEQRHLQDFVALFLASGKTFVDTAIQKIRTHFKQFHLLAHEVVKLQRVEFFLAALRLHRVVGQAQKLAVRDTGYLDRILKGQKHTGTGTLLGRKLKQIPAFEQHAATCYFIRRVTGQHLGEGALARAVRPHDRVYFTAFHGEV